VGFVADDEFTTADFVSLMLNQRMEVRRDLLCKHVVLLVANHGARDPVGKWCEVRLFGSLVPGRICLNEKVRC
jgi:hypothetical protein